MINSLSEFLVEEGYKKIKLKLTKTNHFEIKAKINNVKGRFILDTGASNSCVSFGSEKTFELITKKSKIKASGAGATNMETLISKNNNIRIGKTNFKNQSLILFDLSHVNLALENHNCEIVDGIIGADILKKGEAVIDYKKKHLYLKFKNKKTVK